MARAAPVPKRVQCAQIALIALSIPLWFGFSLADTPPPANKPPPGKLDLSKTNAKSDTENLILPVPSEIVKRFRQTSYGSKLSSSIVIHSHDYAPLPPWKAALTVGLTLSDLLLGIDTLPAAKVTAGLDDLIAGLTRLNVPPAQMQKLVALRAISASPSPDKAKLISGFDEMRVDLLKHGKQLFGSQNYGLLIVGGWAQSANATARIAQAQPAALQDLEVLKMRSVIDTFIQLLGNGPEAKPVVASLNEIYPITTTQRPDALTPQESIVILKATNEILALVRS